MKTVLDIDRLTKRYKNGRGVFDVSFSVGEGEIVGILGPNGSGKTTLMRSVLGFCAFDRGSIHIFGVDPLEHRDAALVKVGALIENPALYENLSARRQLKMMARLYPELPADAVDRVLALTGLESCADEKVRRYSLGMKQRLGIAMAFLAKPQLVILDEPFNGLDIEATAELRLRIGEMAKKERRSFLVSGHQADEMEKLCDRVVILNDGVLVADVTMDEVKKDAPSLEAYFLNCVRKDKGGAL